MNIASTVRSRLPHRIAGLLRPRVLWIVMAASALFSAGAIQHGIDRLEAASSARTQLEREAAGLHERYLAAAAPTTPALQQLRAERDAAVASAAGGLRLTVWAALFWMMGLGTTGAWLQQRRARPSPGEAPAATPCAATDPGASIEAAEVSPAATGSAPSRPAWPAATAPDWQSLRQEIQAIGALIAAEPVTAETARSPVPTAALHVLPVRPAGDKEPVQLRLAA